MTLAGPAVSKFALSFNEKLEILNKLNMQIIKN